MVWSYFIFKVNVTLGMLFVLFESTFYAITYKYYMVKL